jgi:hypothetical protein
VRRHVNQFAGGGFSPVVSTSLVSVVVVLPSGVVTVVSVVVLAFSPQPAKPTVKPPLRRSNASVRFIVGTFHEDSVGHEEAASP